MDKMSNKNVSMGEKSTIGSEGSFMAAKKVVKKKNLKSSTKSVKSVKKVEKAEWLPVKVFDDKFVSSPYHNLPTKKKQTRRSQSVAAQ